MKNLLFVDDEPKVLQALQRQLRDMRHEWSMTFVDGPAKALDFLATTPVDVIISDMVMPDMDGASLLTEVMKRHPNTIRLVLSGHSDREAVLRLVGPVHQYLSKPCDAVELRRAIARAFAVRDLLNNDKLKQLANRTHALPTMPALHAQLTDELRKEEPSMERISEIITRDPGMTAKFLQVVNSPAFGLSQPLANVHDAVVYLGFAAVRAVALWFKTFSQFEGKHFEENFLDGLAQHCWLTGSLARRIAHAERLETKMDDQCFIAGLLHDVGRLVLATGLPDEYAAVCNAARSKGCTLWEAEREAFGVTHAELGAYLLGIWGLPNPVIEAVALHHRPGDAVHGGLSPVIAVHVANVFAHEYSRAKTDWKRSQLDRNCLALSKLDGRLDVWRERCFDEPL